MRPADMLAWWILEQTKGFGSVVEFGCMFGDRLEQVHPDVLVRVGIEAHEPYVSYKRTTSRARPGRIIVHGDMREFEDLVPPGYREVALFVDSLEHLTREDAFDLMGRVMAAFRKVVLFIPKGEHPQTADALKMGADDYQTHRSTWYESDLYELGFDDVTTDDYFYAGEGKAGSLSAMFAVWNRRP